MGGSAGGDDIEATVVVNQLRALLRHPDVIARTFREVANSGATGPEAILAKDDASGTNQQDRTCTEQRTGCDVGQGVAVAGIA